MTNQNQDTLKTAMQVIMTVLLAILVGINGWALHELNTLGKQVMVNTTRLDEYSSAGPRYSRYDAEKDLGVITKLLEAQDKVVDDHEGRIRILERK